MSLTVNEIVPKVKGIIAKILNTEEEKINLESKIVDDLGAESLDIVTMLIELEDAFNKKINDDDAQKLVTVSDIVNYITELSKTSA